MLTPGANNHAKNASIRFALAMAKRPRFQDGGPVTGPLMDAGPGRTDTLPISVPPGSYVIPSDIVSGIPGAQGNSLAGHNALTKLFASLPLSPDEAPYGAGSPQLPVGHTIPGLHRAARTLSGGTESSFAKGGAPDRDAHKPVDIVAAGGEFVVAPHLVKRLGLGSLERGHKVLDEFVKKVRKRNIADLKKLPGPVKK